MDDAITLFDDGALSHFFVDFSKQQRGFLGSGAIITNRPGWSDRLILNMLTEVIAENAGIVFPLPATAQIYRNYCYLLKNNSKLQITPRQLYCTELKTQVSSARLLEKIRRQLADRSKDDHPIIFVFDTLQKITQPVELEIRHLLKDAAYLNLSVWLHCSLQQIPFDLISSIGNVVAIWPSKDEIQILEKHLPSTTDIDFSGKKFPPGILSFNKASNEGWRFSELGKIIGVKNEIQRRS